MTRRHDPAKCSRCNCRPAPAGYRTCQQCRDAQRTPEALADHRERNRRYHDRNRDAVHARNERKRQLDAARATVEGRPYKRNLAAMRDERVVAMAEALGHVPTPNEIVAELGVALRTATVIRRRAFRLKPRAIGGAPPRIPYPVPADMLADGDEWASPSQRPDVRNERERQRAAQARKAAR